MAHVIHVYVEVGSRRTFAAALAWPGWCRMGRDEAAALQALFAYGPRYAHSLEPAQLGFEAPGDISALVVAERLTGNATTDFGSQIGHLHTAGVYRYSRNPQLVGSFVFIIGYVMLWPSRTGMLWATLWVPISWLMVRGEEEHLSRVFGREYEEYCDRTPRYVGIPKKSQPSAE